MSTQPVAISQRSATRHGFSYWFNKLNRFIVYILTAVLGFAFMLPFLWTLSSAFKPPWELYIFPPTWLPEKWTPGNFVEIWQVVPLFRWTVNSFMVAALNVLGIVVTSSIVAYGFSRFKFQGRDACFLVLLSTMMLPAYITIIPSFLMFKYIGWIDTLYPLIVPHFFGGSAFNIFLLRQFFMTISPEFDEAAYMDGANSFTVLWKILLPLSKPALSTAAVFAFLGSWSNFLTPLIFLNTKEKFTLPLGLTWFRVNPLVNPGVPRDHLLMAASVTMTLPAVILFFAAQQYFISGIVMGGLKG